MQSLKATPISSDALLVVSHREARHRYHTCGADSRQSVLPVQMITKALSSADERMDDNELRFS
jgi:hypothetical protein